MERMDERRKTGKRRKRRRRNAPVIPIVLGVVVLLLVAVVAGVFFFRGKKEKEQTPEEALQAYVDLLNARDYQGAYACLTEDTAQVIDAETFVERHEKIYGGMDVSDIRVEIHPEAEEEKKASDDDVTLLEYTMTMETLAGELSFDSSMLLTKNEETGAYALGWDYTNFLPNFKESDKISVSTVAAKRGNIYDQNGEPLAHEGVASSIGIVPGKLPEDREAALEKLAELLELTVEKLEKELSAGWVKEDSFVPIRTVSKDAAELKEAVLEIPGVMITDTKLRVYPLGKQAAQLTGYVQSITAEELAERQGEGYSSNSIIGKAGLEKIYEKQLKGQDGCSITVVHEDGSREKLLEDKEPVDGQDITLTIDAALQSTLYEQLSQDEGCAVAMDPSTGAVLALVSTPAYDPNDFVMGYTSSAWTAVNEDPAQPLFNRFRATFAPGSAFKPVVAAAALTEGTLDADAEADHSGLKWQKDSSWGNYYVTTLQDYSPKNLENALIYSDNIYFAKAALGLGEEKFAASMKKLGFLETMPFAYEFKASTFGENGEIQSETELADSGYGQGKVLVNPLHLATMYSAFVNQGSMIQPYLEQGQSETGFWKEQVFTEEAAETVLSDLIQVVENPDGTGHEAYFEALTLAGKTGTAEIKASQDDTTGTELGWFVGMSVNERQPLLIVMMAEDVKGRGGSHYVVPKVKAGFQTYYSTRPVSNGQ